MSKLLRPHGRSILESKLRLSAIFFYSIADPFHSIRCHGLCPWFDAVLARGHATGKWRPEGSSLDDHLWANEKSRTTIKEG